MTDRREFARKHAEAYGETTLRAIGKVLEVHNTGVVEFACEMQQRLDAAEALLAEVADARALKGSADGMFSTIRLPAETMHRITALMASVKARTP